MAEENALVAMKEALTDKVRGMVMGMLPDAVIHDAIEHEFKRITTGVMETDYSGRQKRTVPLLNGWIREALEPLAKEHVKKAFEEWLKDPVNDHRVATWIERAVRAAAQERFKIEVTSTVESVLRGWNLQPQKVCNNCGSYKPESGNCPNCGTYS